MRATHISLISAALILAAGAAVGQTFRVQRDDRGGGMSFRFERGDRRGDVEGKRASAAEAGTAFSSPKASRPASISRRCTGSMHSKRKIDTR